MLARRARQRSRFGRQGVEEAGGWVSISRHSRHPSAQRVDGVGRILTSRLADRDFGGPIWFQRSVRRSTRMMPRSRSCQSCAPLQPSLGLRTRQHHNDRDSGRTATQAGTPRHQRCHPRTAMLARRQLPAKRPVPYNRPRAASSIVGAMFAPIRRPDAPMIGIMAQPQLHPRRSTHQAPGHPAEPQPHQAPAGRKAGTTGR